ncbi:MAG: NERD domain-containing protein [Oligoflexus sp.]
MATIFPDHRQKRIIFASKAEETFYRYCEQLPDSWNVYYSCTLSSLEPEKGLVDNEIDFVLYHPKHGLYVIEVKGWSISFDANVGQFYSVNRHGKSFAIKDPFQQALVWKSRFLRFLKNRGVKVPTTHLVSFPSVNEDDIPQSASVSPDLIIGRQRIADLEAYLKQISKMVHPAQFLNFQDCRRDLDGILRGTTYTTRLYLRDYIDNHDSKVRDIEVIHETLLTPIASTKRLAIEGEAGTGKTVLAMMLARHFRDQGKTVLLLSSNPLLNNYMKTETGSGVDVQTYWELASSYGIELLRRPNGYDGSREDWIQYVGPERLKDAILQSNRRYDVLLCDEAQDVQPFWWESLETVLQGEESHFYIFFDRSQGVFGSGSSDSSFIPEDVLPIRTPYFPLVHNYRITREISGFSRTFRTGTEIMRSHSARLGYFPEIIAYEDERDAEQKLAQLFRKLFEKEGLKTSEVTILSARRPFVDGSWFKDIKKLGNYGLLDIGTLKHRNMPRPEELQGNVPVSTISSFKGLETSVGIITNLSEYNLPFQNPIMSSLFYVACTRAKHMLYIMVKKGDDKFQVVKEALDRLENTGAMIVDQVSDFEFSGTVAHYNPDRVGWLKVDDPAFQKGSIMFFPHDIDKAKLKEVKVGMRLQFTTRVEGFVPIACNLKTIA